MNILHNFFGIPKAFAQSMNNQNSNLASETSGQIQNLFESFFKAIPLWITGLIVILGSFVLAKIVRSAVENKMSEEGLEESHREIQIVAGRVASATVLTVGITIGLKIAGIDLTNVIAAAAFGIGFAMRDFIMNFLAGIIVLLQKQFTIGDWIKVGKTMGIIEEIQARYTVVKNFDGTKVIIPNADLFRKQVTSLTHNPLRRFQFDLAIDRYLSLPEAIKVIKGSIKKVKNILLEPKPSVIVLPPGNFQNILRIRCWVESRKGILSPQSKLIKQIHKDFYARGWSWPYPTQTVILDKDLKNNVEEKAQEYIANAKPKKESAPENEQVVIVPPAQIPNQPVEAVLQLPESQG